jgi:glycosyltransferase involved in cell wall biosynthesis
MPAVDDLPCPEARPRAATGSASRKTMTGSPRLCLLTETYYPVVGGGEKQTQMLAADLVANGIDVFVMTRRSSRDLAGIDSVDGVRVCRVSPVGAARWPRWRMVFTSLALLARLRHDYDIIVVSGFKALGLSAVVAARLFGKQCILKADSNGEMSGAFFAGGLKAVWMTPGSWLFRVFLAVRNAILRRADHFVAITGGIADEFRQQRIDAQRIHVVSNGVDTTRFRPAGHARQLELRRRLGLPKADVLLVYSGRLVSYKGLPLLVRVAERLQREQSVGLVLVGAGGMDMHNCEREIRELTIARGLGASVHFAGEVSNVDEFLQASDIFVLPTEDDAFPLALVEAMACGLPVVSTRVGGIVDIVTDGQDGVLVEAGDFEQLANALGRVIADTSFSAALGAAAALTVQARYSRRIVAQRYIALLQHVHARRPSRSLARRVVRWTRP